MKIGISLLRIPVNNTLFRALRGLTARASIIQNSEIMALIGRNSRVARALVVSIALDTRAVLMM